MPALAQANKPSQVLGCFLKPSTSHMQGVHQTHCEEAIYAINKRDTRKSIACQCERYWKAGKICEAGFSSWQTRKIKLVISWTGFGLSCSGGGGIWCCTKEELLSGAARERRRCSCTKVCVVMQQQYRQEGELLLEQQVGTAKGGIQLLTWPFPKGLLSSKWTM